LNPKRQSWVLVIPWKDMGTVFSII
jgi:hypothetical protein